MWRIGILSGTGTARKRTIPALAKSDVCQVTVVHGRDPRRLAEIAHANPHIRVTAAEPEFVHMRDLYDVVYIGSPPFLHFAQVRAAAELGLPTICEKPLVSRREELDQLVAVISDAAIPFMLAHHVRHQPAVTDVAAIVQTGQFGVPVSASLQWCFLMNHRAGNAAWKLDPRLGGTSAMFDSGVHALDLAILFFGAPRRVGALGHHTRSADVLDTVVAMLEYPDFAVSVVASQSADHGENGLRITFPQGVLRAPGMLSEKSVRAVDLDIDSATTRLSYQPVDLYRAEVENFCLALGTDAPVGTTLAESAAAARVLFAIEDSLDTGRLVVLNP